MRNFRKLFISTVFITFNLLLSATVWAEACKDSSGTIITSQPIEGISLCATVTDGRGDVAPYGNPDGKLDISDAVVTVQMFMQLLDNVDQAYMNQADVAPLCTQENKDAGSCSSSGNDTVNISDAVVIVRLAMKLEEWVTDEEITKLLFDLAGATSLQAMDSLIEEVPETQRSWKDFPHLRYRVIEPSSQRQRAAGGAGSNLIAVDAEGHARLAIQSDLPVKVMYTVASPDREYVYIALDPEASQTLVAKKDCALFRVKKGDNSSRCVLPGVYLQDFDGEFKKKFGGLKPIQFDDSGNLFFAGSAFTVDGNTINTGAWQPIIYRYNLVTQVNTPVTHDAMEVRFFMVLATGKLVFQGANVLSGEEKLWLYDSGSSISLSSIAPNFLSRDTWRALFWSGRDAQQQPGIWFARPKEGGEQAVLKAILYTHTQNGEAASPEQLLVGDDGRLYGAFLTSSGVEINRLLPYQNTPKALFTLPISGALRSTVMQVSKGYLYYLENMDPRDGLGTHDVIYKVDLANGEKETLLSDNRYEIFAWRLSGHELHFSGLDLVTTTLVMGKIDTLQVRQGEPVSVYLTTNTVASALSVAGKVQDIEILTPQQPITDPGRTAVGITKITEDHPYSLSIEFTKYMNKPSVEENLWLSSLQDDIPVFPLWFYTALHLVPDRDGLLDNSKTVPLAWSTKYNLTVGHDALDAYNWPLVDENEQAGIDKHFTLTPPSGVDLGNSDTPTISTIADQTTMMNTVLNDIHFSVADLDTSIDALSVTAVSSDQTLVANDQIFLGDTEGERTIEITPIADQFGSVTITVTVSDGTKSASTNFFLTVLRENIAPTISHIENQTIQVDATTGEITFNIGDNETPTSDLAVTANSSNTTLVDASGLLFSGAGAERSIMVTPIASQSGEATIVVVVSDGELSASTSFVLTVTAASHTPIATDSYHTVDGGAVVTGTLIASDADDDTLTYQLVDNAHLGTVSLDATTGTYTYTPNAGVSGTDSFTFKAHDGTDDSPTATVTLTINAVNDSPTISPMDDQITKIDAPTGAISFTVDDSETAANNLTVSGRSSNTVLIPDSGFAFAGSGENRTLTITPASGRSGSATITVQVSDSDKSASISFTLVVTETVQNLVPIASLTVSASSGKVADFFQWDASSSLDAEDSSNHLQVRWDWESDGTWDTAYTITKTASHAFSAAGTYTVLVEIKDSAGQTDTASVTVTVVDEKSNSVAVTTNSLVSSVWIVVPGDSQPSHLAKDVGVFSPRVSPASMPDNVFVIAQ